MRLEAIHSPHCKHRLVTGVEGEGLISNGSLVTTILSPVHPKNILLQKVAEKSLSEGTFMR